jgi:hypothetical protein
MIPIERMLSIKRIRRMIALKRMKMIKRMIRVMEDAFNQEDDSSHRG